MKTFFEVPFEGCSIKGDILGESPQLLVLHGAGTANRARFDVLREKLFARGVSSLAFDFMGHGETGGELLGSSLKQRSEQVLVVLSHLNITYPISILAASMSGYTAIKLLPVVSVTNLFLLAPGVYSSHAYTLRFGPELSQLIRQENNWFDSDAWELLEKYTGGLYIFRAEHDQVVPKELTDKLFDSAVCAQKKRVIVIEGATHPLGVWLNHHPEDLEKVVQEIISALT